MKLQTFQADSMAAAITKVKRALGDAAVIVHTRALQPAGPPGARGRPRIEITAAAPPAEPPPPRAVAPVPVSAGETPTSASARLAQELAAVPRRRAEQPQRDAGPSRPRLTPSLRALYARLLRHHVADEIAAQIVADLRAIDPADPAALHRALAEAIAAMLPPEPPAESRAPVRATRPRVIALVGPTGVGKTTSVAKLAADLKFRRRQSVGLINLDHHRVAAREQIAAYGRILELPARLPRTPAELRAALAELQTCDVVLIDTAGIPPRDAARLADLKQLLDTAAPDEVHLVLAGTTDAATAVRAARQFDCLAPTRVLFTKLDEAAGVGLLLNVIEHLRLRWSYLATGQRIPDDLEPATVRRLAQMLLET